MINRLSLMVLLACMMVTGCSALVPSTVKREVSFIRVDVETIYREVKDLEATAAATLATAQNLEKEGKKEEAFKQYKLAADQYKAAQAKAMRSYHRVLPHLKNVENYMQKKKPTEE